MEKYDYDYLQITETRKANTLEYQLHGEIDPCTSEGLDDRLTYAVHDEGIQEIAVDLSGINFIDCSGLTVFITAHDKAVEQNKKLRIYRPSRIAQKVIKIAKVDQILDIQESVYKPQK
jgi:anti-sigma B factor antagonist